MQNIHFDNLIEESINKINLGEKSAEVILKEMSHQILKWAVNDIDFVKTNILRMVPVDNILITDRLLFQYYDCIFRESTGWEIHKCISELSRALEYFDEFKNLPSHLMFSGALSMLKGDRELAYKFYSESSKVANSEFAGLPRMFLGGNSVLTDIDWVGENKKLPGVQVLINQYFSRQDDEGAGVIFFAADNKYFGSFKDFILDNLKKVNSKTAVHFHVVDCNEAYKKLDPHEYGDYSVNYSREDFKYFRDKTFFATSRFYRALEILNKYNKSIYISDIDNRFIQNPAEFFEKVKGFDIGLRFNKNGDWFPWWGPSAGSFYAANTDMGRTFLKHLKEYISAKFNVNKPSYTWWFDQLALNDVYHYCKENYPEMKFVNLNDHEYLLSVIRHDDELQSLKSK